MTKTQIPLEQLPLAGLGRPIVSAKSPWPEHGQS